MYMYVYKVHRAVSQHAQLCLQGIRPRAYGQLGRFFLFFFRHLRVCLPKA